MNPFKLYAKYLPLLLLAIVFATASFSSVLAQTQQTNIRQLLVEKTASEKADIKGREIARIIQKDVYNRSGVQIEVVDIQAIDGGVEVFVRTWKNGKQIGFGNDGSVDIERFRIFNPPILVPDPKGDIVRKWIGEDGTEQQHTFREDPKEALLQVIEHNLSVMKNIHGDERIVKGKRGNTTSTFFSSTNDGTFLSDAKATYSGARDATSADSIDQGNGNFVHNSFITGSNYYVRRFVTYFDTSTIPDSDTISTATYSLATLAGGGIDAPQSSDSDSIAVVGFSGSNPPVVADFNDFGSTSYGTTTIASWSTTDGTYNNIALNATGIAAISKTVVTSFGARTLNDINNVTPTGRNQIPAYQADEAGTSKDPKLVVEHTNSAPSAPTSLLTEGQTNPVNISDPTPEFSAIYNDPDSGDVATFYRIQVATSSTFSSTFWDTGTTTMATTTAGNRSPDISYAGTGLASSTTYYLRIAFSDDDGATGAWSMEETTFSLSEAPASLKARKNSDESVQNSSTLQPDDHLVLALQANKKYIVDGMIFVSAGSATPDLKITFASTTGSTFVIGYLNDSSNEVLSGVTSSNIPLPGSNTFIPIYFSGTITTAGTAGDLTLQWAQNTANANATTIHAGSFIRAEEI